MKNELSLIIEPREKDIGIPVRRILPWAKKRMVGPFIFLDHMGPVILKAPSDHVDVRPHPHIGLSTLTYLFEGSLLHRDSLGYVQEILPSEVNWMTAGKGISHSERETTQARTHDRILHGLQFWVALPKAMEDMEPSFYHYGQNEIPTLVNASSEIKLIAGSVGEVTSPLKAHSKMLFIILKAKLVGHFQLSAQGQELAFYVVKGSVSMNHSTYHQNQMVVLTNGSDLEIEYSADAVVAVIGGMAFPEERFIWWNLVSSSPEKIEAAKRAWDDRSFPQVPGDSERIPLPES